MSAAIRGTNAATPADKAEFCREKGTGFGRDHCCAVGGVENLRLFEVPGWRFRNHRLVTVHARHLVERAFVPVQVEPAHAVENHLYGLERGAGHVGVLDAQDELTAMAPDVSP